MFRRARRTAGVITTLAVLCFGRAGAEPPATPPPTQPPANESPVRLLDVPFVPQTPALCGGAAIAMVLRYWGEPGVLAETFAGLIQDGEAGIRTDAMAAAVRARGWTAMPATGAPSEIRAELAKGRPVIALIQVGSGLYHYVVLVGWANGGVILHDPAVAPFRVRKEREFDDAWNAADRWALVILPPERAAEPAPSGAARSSQPSAAPLTGCDAIVEDAVARARNGDLAGAEERLRSAEALCPASAAPARGLAGLRFKAEDYQGAARFAERALVLDPSDRYTWRLLAGSRFLSGDEEGALQAWNQVAEPRADLTRIDGLARTRYRAVSGQLGLKPGDVLRSGAYVRARRRLGELPAQSSSRLSLKPLAQGTAQVNVAMLERPLLFDGAIDVGAAGIRAVAEREISLRLASPSGNGELWAAAYRWQRARPSVSLRLAVPAPGGRPGLWTVGGLWERQTYAGATSANLDGTSTSPLTREERRRTSLSFADWIAPNLRLEIGTALDRWSTRGAHVALEGRVDAPFAGDRLVLSVEAARWVSLESAAPFATGGLLTRWSSAPPERGGWLARVGVAQASSTAPLALWPGAGTGRGRAPLLRAHPLLDEGVVAGRAFGRTLVQTGLERIDWIARIKSLRVGSSLFVDGAKISDPLRSAGEPWLFDAGVGVRLAAWGGRGALRIDAAHGLNDRKSAISVGWDVR